MAGEAPQFSAAEVRIPIVPDTEAMDAALDGVEERMLEIADRFTERIARGLEGLEVGGEPAAAGATGGAPVAQPDAGVSQTLDEIREIVERIEGALLLAATRVPPGG